MVDNDALFAKEVIIRLCSQLTAGGYLILSRKSGWDKLYSHMITNGYPVFFQKVIHMCTWQMMVIFPFPGGQDEASCVCK